MSVEELDYEALPESASVATHLAAGALAGIAEHTVMYPFDSIKTRMQIISGRGAIYSGVLNAARQISTTEGARTLWRGINSVILGAGPSHALYFATYERCKVLFGAENSDVAHHGLRSAAAGAVATTAADALMNPFDVIKQRMQLQSGAVYRSVWDCASKVFRTEGISAFYVSYPTTLLMNIPFHSIQFSAYETFSKIINPSGEYSPKAHITSGALAGAIAAAATTPLDVAKTLLQTRGGSTDAQIRQASGIFSALRIIYQQHGVAGFFKGFQPRIITHVPSVAITWAVYEYFKWSIGGGAAARDSAAAAAATAADKK
ncbi:mitochondrial carrier [Ramicandelaber brevisporus]|nr:mitochondrial carrier [Ramicandelaber brevisporus]KAI8870018.1 mitochondrial carrier [Ramicandelaber brevisporus]